MIKKELFQILLIVFLFEFKILFKNMFFVTALTLLKQYSSFKKIASLKHENLVKLFRNIKGNNFNYQKALKIIENELNKIFLDAVSKGKTKHQVLAKVKYKLLKII